jgi:hypothetical protein
MAARQHLTVTHGDFLFGNVLLPNDPQQHAVSRSALARILVGPPRANAEALCRSRVRETALSRSLFHSASHSCACVLRYQEAVANPLCCLTPKEVSYVTFRRSVHTLSRRHS